MIKLKFIIIGISLIFCSCDGSSDGENSGTNTNSDLITTVSSSSPDVILEGEHPLDGDEGAKRVVVFDTLFDLENTWQNFSTSQTPDIDFSTHNVLLFDLGGERDSDSCGNEYLFNSAEVESVTTEILTDGIVTNDQINTHVILNTTKCLPDGSGVCDDVLTPHRPFYFILVEKNGEISFKENVTFLVCG